MERLRYVLSHGCKEDLVARSGDGPGVHCVEALTLGIPLTGYWFDRTQEFAARRRPTDENLFPRGSGTATCIRACFRPQLPIFTPSILSSSPPSTQSSRWYGSMPARTGLRGTVTVIVCSVERMRCFCM